MNSKEIFSLALNLQPPWFIKDITLEKGDSNLFGRLTIQIDFEKGARFTMSDGQEYSAYDTEIKTWQHLNFFEHECFISARVPRVQDNENRVLTVQVPWSRPGSGFTLLFEAFAMLLIEKEMPVNKVAKTVRVTAPRLWRVFNYWIKKAIAKDNVSSVEQIGIDETSSRKGHNYVTVTVDVQERRVIHACEGKDADAVRHMKQELQAKGLRAENIRNVCIDMSPAFISGVFDNFPDTEITFDRFHIKKLLNEAFDKVRQLERKGNDLLKGHKYTFLKAYEKLSGKKQRDLDMLVHMYPKLGEAYRLKVMFDDFWEMTDIQDAQGYLAFWCDMVNDSKIFPLIEFVKTIKAHWFGIVNYLKSNITAGVIEGINNKIQLAKRRARGYRRIDNFINMIYFLCGKLKFDYPQYPL
ncbi:MAG: ISL3 family transposase [Bacteroidales bacterium]|nr:ISL3 family transposase [Bacteroidales bacterium]